MKNYSDIHQVPISLPLPWQGAEDRPCTFYHKVNSAYMENWSNPVALPWTGDRYDITKTDDKCGHFGHISNAFRGDKSCIDLFWNHCNMKYPSDAFNYIRNMYSGL